MTDKEEVKIAVIGGGAVGKSSMTILMTSEKFTDGEYDPTIEDVYYLMTRVDDKPIYLELLDTAGQDEYKALRPQYMRACFGFLMVFDLTSRSSLDNLVEFIEEIRRVKDLDDDEPFPGVLCGNKLDLCEHKSRQVLIKDMQEFSKKYLNNSPIMETSAITGHNVKESFFKLVREVRKARERMTRKPKVKKQKWFESSAASEEKEEDLEAFKSI